MTQIQNPSTPTPLTAEQEAWGVFRSVVGSLPTSAPLPPRPPAPQKPVGFLGRLMGKSPRQSSPQPTEGTICWRMDLQQDGRILATPQWAGENRDFPVPLAAREVGHLGEPVLPEIPYKLLGEFADPRCDCGNWGQWNEVRNFRASVALERRRRFAERLLASCERTSG